MHCYKLIVYWLGKDMWPATGRIVLLNNNQTIVDLASIRNRAAIRKDLEGLCRILRLDKYEERKDCTVK